MAITRSYDLWIKNNEGDVISGNDPSKKEFYANNLIRCDFKEMFGKDFTLLQQGLAYCTIKEIEYFIVKTDNNMLELRDPSDGSVVKTFNV